MRGNRSRGPKVPWTTGEVARLQNYISQGDTVKAAAQKLGRTHASVASAMNNLGIYSLNRIGINYKWTAEQCAQLEALYCAGASKDEMCAELDRSKGAIVARLTLMGTCKRCGIQRLAAKARLRGQRRA